MIRATAPTITATMSTGLVLKVIEATLGLDESWSPYATASLRIAEPTAAQLATIDPRKGLRVAIAVDDHADLFGQAKTSRTFDLALRDRQWNVADGELTLSCYSDEQLLIDHVLLLKNVRDWGQTSLRALCAAVLAEFGAVLAPGATDTQIDPAAAVQSPGQSYWDFLAGTLTGAGYRLWCDETRTWRLDDRNAIAAGLVTLAYGATVTALNDAIALDSDYADSLVVRYSYLDASGNAQTSYDYAAASSTPRRGTRLDFESAPFADGAARRLLRRLTGRGRVLTHQAVSRFDVTPTQSFISTPPAGADPQAGIVSGITWQLPTDRMDVRTRELTDTIGTAWAAMAAGVTWESIPAGLSWARYLAISWNSPPKAIPWSSIPAGYRWSEFDKYLKENS